MGKQNPLSRALFVLSAPYWSDTPICSADAVKRTVLRHQNSNLPKRRLTRKQYPKSHTALSRYQTRQRTGNSVKRVR